MISDAGVVFVTKSRQYALLLAFFLPKSGSLVVQRVCIKAGIDDETALNYSVPKYPSLLHAFLIAQKASLTKFSRFSLASSVSSFIASPLFSMPV